MRRGVQPLPALLVAAGAAVAVAALQVSGGEPFVLGPAVFQQPLGVSALVFGDDDAAAFVGPGFYLLGRYDHRLSANEAALLHVERQMETMVERSIKTGERIADAVENLGAGGINIECPGPK